jgi:hypothetical protein
MKRPTGTNLTPAGERLSAPLVNGMVPYFTPKDNHFERRRNLSPPGSSLSFGSRMWTPIVLCLRNSYSTYRSAVMTYSASLHAHTLVKSNPLSLPPSCYSEPILGMDNAMGLDLLYELQLYTLSLLDTSINICRFWKISFQQLNDLDRARRQFRTQNKYHIKIMTLNWINQIDQEMHAYQFRHSHWRRLGVAERDTRKSPNRIR